jgi:hypothetical protein
MATINERMLGMRPKHRGAAGGIESRPGDQ